MNLWLLFGPLLVFDALCMWGLGELAWRKFKWEPEACAFFAWSVGVCLLMPLNIFLLRRLGMTL